MIARRSLIARAEPQEQIKDAAEKTAKQAQETPKEVAQKVSDSLPDSAKKNGSVRSACRKILARLLQFQRLQNRIRSVALGRDYYLAVGSDGTLVA